MQWKYGKFTDLQTDDMETLAAAMFKKFTRLARDNKVNLVYLNCTYLESFFLEFIKKPLELTKHYYKGHVIISRIARRQNEFLAAASGGLSIDPP